MWSRVISFFAQIPAVQNFCLTSFLLFSQVLITSKVVSVEESTPPEDKEPVSEEVVTVVHTEKQHFEPDDLKLILDDQLDTGEPVDVSLQQPAAFVRRQSGSKVKKRRSFREKMSKRLSSGH